MTSIINFMRKFVPFFLLILLVLIVFHSWFLPGLLSTFDFLYYSPDMMRQAHLGLYAWDWHIGFDGFALFFSPYSWVFPFIFGPQVLFGKYLGMDWSVIEKIAYLCPYLILMIVSPIFFTKYLFPKNKFYLLAVLVFSFNTYALLLAGGEVYLALAYALAPILFVLFVKQIHKKSLRLALIISLVLSLQIMFDPRITYVTMVGVILYLVLSMRYQVSKENIRNTLYVLLYTLIIPGIVTTLLQSFWIIPTVLYGKNPVQSLGVAYAAAEAVKFFSFAKFENTISLLHQNWPENIFGKVYFMRPEFLLVPVLAFASLLFIRTKAQKDAKQYAEQRIVLFFALLGLIGAFLSKGVNDPFGGIYLWLFAHFPGFIMFRDPTKFYLLVSLSYSVLIPYSLWQISEKVSHSKYQVLRRYGKCIVVFVFILFWLVTIRQAVFGQLTGMFKTTSIPSEYVTLDTFISSQPEYFRTLWYPVKQHFGYYSANHPEMSGQVLFNIYDDKKLFATFSKPSTEKLLEEASIKYVIVPYDSEKEIFLTDRKFDESKYQKTISDLQKISWLRPVSLPENCELRIANCEFGRIAVFQVADPKEHFYFSKDCTNADCGLRIRNISPVEYQVTVSNVRKGERLVLSESFDSHWVATVESSKVASIKYDNRFNSFILPQDGSYTLDVYYTPQDWVNVGEWVSLVTLVLVGGSLIIMKFKSS